MSKEQTDYVSYLLRLWRVHDNGPGTWRAELRSAKTGERIGFASLDELFVHLSAETGTSVTPGGEQGCASRSS